MAQRVLSEREQPPDRNPRSPDLARLPAGYHVTPIPMKAGDLAIWDRLLAQRCLWCWQGGEPMERDDG